MAVAVASPSRPSVANRAERLLPRLALLGFVAGLGYLVVLPLYRLQTLAFADGAQGYRTAYGSPKVWETLRTTVGLAVGSLSIALVLGTLLAWAATRLPAKSAVLRTLPIMPIIVPSVASVIGWSFLLSPRPGYLNALMRMLPWWSDLDTGPVDVYSLPWIIIITGFGLTAFVYLFVSAGMQNINTELVEAAQVSGSSQLTIFVKVILPLLRPSLVYGGGVALLLGLGQFTGPLLLGRQSGVSVLTTEMYNAVGQTPADYAAAAALGSPLLIFGFSFVIIQKVILGDQTRFVTHAGKGFKSTARPSRIAKAGILLYSFLATVLPVTALLLVSLSSFWSGKVDPSKFTLANFQRIFKEGRVVDAIFTSLTVSLAAVLIALPIGFIVARLLLKGKQRPILRSIVDFLVAMPLGIPAVIFGVGFLLTYTQQPVVLYGTKWVIVLVYVTLMLPFTTRMQLAGMVALGDNYVEAARVSGAGSFRTAAQILLPLMRPTLGGAGALMFVLLTHEFAASLLVRAPTTQVMGTVLFDFYTNGSYPLVAAIALIMTVVTAFGVVIAMLLGGGSDVFNKL